MLSTSIRVCGAARCSRTRPLQVAGVGHRQVEHDEFPIRRAHLLERLREAGGLADRGVGPALHDELAYAEAHHRMVVDDQQLHPPSSSTAANGTLASILTLPPAPEPILSSPPASAARSRMLNSPSEERACCAMPTPSSSTTVRYRPSTAAPSILTRAARAWRATLVSASRAMR